MARFLRKSFLERNQKLIGAIGVAALIGGAAFSLLLSSGVFARTYHVTAYFTDAAGIETGDPVTVAGLKAGLVKSVEVQNGRVAMDLAVGDSVKLPADSRAQVVILTLLGKETVQLVAGQSRALLHDGSVIPVSRTTTPVSITQLNDIQVNLLQKSNIRGFNDFLATLTKITTGKEAEVHTIIDGLERVSAAVDSRRAQLAGLLDALRTLSTTLGDKNQTIVSLIDNLDVVLGNLAQRQQDIKQLLVATSSGTHAMADLIARNRTVLDHTLSTLHQDLDVLANHQLDLAGTISYLNQAVEGYSSVGYSNGVPNQWANVFVQSLGPLGIDAFLGPCGAVDQMINQLLGTSCGTNAQGGTGGSSSGGGGSSSGGGGLPIPTPTSSLPGGGLPIPTPSLSLGPPGASATSARYSAPPLPGTVFDLVLSTLAGSPWEKLI